MHSHDNPSNQQTGIYCHYQLGRWRNYDQLHEELYQRHQPRGKDQVRWRYQVGDYQWQGNLWSTVNSNQRWLIWERLDYQVVFVPYSHSCLLPLHYSWLAVQIAYGMQETSHNGYGNRLSKRAARDKQSTYKSGIQKRRMATSGMEPVSMPQGTANLSASMSIPCGNHQNLLNE